MEIEALANKLAAALARELSLSEDDRDIAAYALHGIFSVSFYLSTLLISAWLLGQWKYTLIVAGTVAVLRTFMGGAHASTAWRCGLIGAAMMNGAARWHGCWRPPSPGNTPGCLKPPRPRRRWQRWRPSPPTVQPTCRKSPSPIPGSAAGCGGSVRHWWQAPRLPLTLAAAQRGWETVYFSAQAGLWIQLLLVTPVGFGWSGRVDAYLTKLLRKEE